MKQAILIFTAILIGGSLTYLTIDNRNQSDITEKIKENNTITKKDRSSTKTILASNHINNHYNLDFTNAA